MNIYVKKILLVLLLMGTVFVAGCDAFDRYDEEAGDRKDYDGMDATVYDFSNDSDVDEKEAPNKQNDETDNPMEDSSNSFAERGDTDAGKNENMFTKDDTRDGIGLMFEDMLIEVYYQDAEGSLIPVTRRIPRQLSVASASIKALIDTPTNREEIAYFRLYPTLPQGTEFTINVKDNVAIIDFNEKVLKYETQIREHNFIASVVYTLTQFETIDKVKILINGYIQETLKHGTDISGELNRGNILVNFLGSTEKDINLVGGVKKIDVYLLKTIKENIFALPVSLICLDPYEDSLQREIIKYLGASYEGHGIFSEVPESLKLIGSSIRDGLLTLNLNLEDGNYGGTEREFGMINQILYSMKQVGNVDRVRFLINGADGELLEGTDISEPIPIPPSINDVIDL